MSSRDGRSIGPDLGRSLSPSAAERLLVREYGRMASAWDRYSVTTRPVVWKEIRTLLANTRGQHALDLACGSGAHTVRLARAVGPNGFVVGIDAAEGMIRFAQRRPEARRQGNLEFLVMDAHRLKFPDRSFDLVLSTFGLAFSGRRRCLREVYRVLKEGGRFLFVSWHQEHPERTIFLDALAALRIRSPPPLSVRRLARAHQLVNRLPENRPRRGKPTMARELLGAGFRPVRRVVRPVSVRFRNPAAYVRYKSAWGEYERDLRRLSAREKREFVEDLVRRMRWTLHSNGPTVTWNLAFTEGRKP